MERKCKICGFRTNTVKGLVNHFRVHKISSKEYYDKFIRADTEGICPNCNSETGYYGLKIGYKRFCNSKCFIEFCKGKTYDIIYGKEKAKEIKEKQSKQRIGSKNPFYGKHHTQEVIEIIREANTGKNSHTKRPEERKRTSESKKGNKHHFYGRHLSKEHRENISKSLIGKMCGVNNSFYGKHHTEEWSKKHSEQMKGRFEGNNNPFYGKHHTQENKVLIGNLHKELWKNEEYAKEMFRKFNRRPNQIEHQLTELLEKIKRICNFIGNVNFKYVGDGKVWIVGKNPDFIDTGNRLIIELFGDYWHKKEDEIIRKEHFSKYNYVTLIIWQHELKDKNILINKIINFIYENIVDEKKHSEFYSPDKTCLGFLENLWKGEIDWNGRE